MYLKQDNFAILGIILAPTLELFFLYFFFSHLKEIRIVHDSISFSNPLISAICTSVLWKEYDSCYTIQEYTDYKNYEAIWLIKDNRIKNRISSFYYNNYTELKSALKIEINGEIKMSPLNQSLCILMKKKVKNIA